jgi:hypothetical protein
MNLRESYRELLSLTQIHLLNEYKAKDICLASPSTFAYFQKKAVKAAPKQRVISPPPIQQASYPDPQPARPAPNPNQPKPQTPPTTPLPQPTPPTMPPEQPTPSPDPQIPPIQDTTKKTGNFGRKPFTLEPMSASEPYQMDHSLRDLIISKFPKHQIYEAIPDDTIARKLKNAWQKENTVPPVLILTFNQDEQHLLFLKNIAKAISLCLAPARVLSGLKIETEKKWDKLVHSPEVKLIIACDYGFFLQPGLKEYYREEPKLGKHYIGNISLLLLSDLDLYLQQPQLKPLLWQAICKELR